MDYRQIISVCEESEHLISMVPIERVVAFGYQIGLNEGVSVLDFCCGYGEMLKIWSEAFGVKGIGIDRDESFIETGKARLKNNNVSLIAGDIFTYDQTKKHDVVVCTEMSGGGPFDSFKNGIAFFERFINPGGKFVFGKLFSKIPNPPQELIDFDGELPTLCDIYEEAKQCGYYITVMASDTAAQWERYITQSAKRDLEHLRKNPDDTGTAAWLDKWYRMYFAYRRRYEGWGLFAAEKLLTAKRAMELKAM